MHKDPVKCSTTLLEEALENDRVANEQLAIERWEEQHRQKEMALHIFSARLIKTQPKTLSRTLVGGPDDGRS